MDEEDEGTKLPRKLQIERGLVTGWMVYIVQPGGTLEYIEYSSETYAHPGEARKAAYEVARKEVGKGRPVWMAQTVLVERIGD